MYAPTHRERRIPSVDIKWTADTNSGTKCMIYGQILIEKSL